MTAAKNGSRLDAPALVGLWFLPDGLDDVASLSDGDGSPDRDRLSGRVEVDETLVGVKSMRASVVVVQDRKALVASPSRCCLAKVRARRMRCVPDASGASLVPFRL